MKLLIASITYNDQTAKYLPYFLPSVLAQTFTDYKVVVQDNSDRPDNANADYIKKDHSVVELNYSGGNLGFARANNRLVKRARELGAEYILFLNPDMVLEPDAVAKLVQAMDMDSELGSVSPKIMRWDFLSLEKTGLIDSCGIREISALRFVDIGQGEPDKGQYDNAEILGPSGAAALYRLEALEKVAEPDVFDERMFMYKEDADLAYRLHIAGFRSKLAPKAIIYHDRSAGGAGDSNIKVALNRHNKSRQVREWSFLNQHLIFKKHWHTLRAKGKLQVIWFAFRMLVFALLFEPYLLKQYFKKMKKQENEKTRK